jgi:hypothetical protein
VSSDTADGEYEHDPDRFPLADREHDDGDGLADEEPPASEEFGRRGWVLVGVLLVSFFAVPLAILYRPPGVPFEVAFLVLPLLPAGLLGATAIWAMAGRADR